MKNIEFKRLVEILLNEYKQSINEISNKINMDEKEFYKYYSGYKEETLEIIENLNKYIESLKKGDNEFRKLVDKIGEKYQMTHREMARKIDITEVSFFRYYDGARKTKQEIIDKLEELYKNLEDESIKKENNEFKKLVDDLASKNNMILREVARKLNLTDIDFHLYYEGHKEVEPEIMERLNKLINKKENHINEFKDLVDSLGYTYQELINELKISNELFNAYYKGIKEADSEIIDKLKELKANKKDRRYEFAEIIHRLSRLNNEHKKEIYNLINLYSEEEKNTKKLTPNNKD